MQLFRLRYLTAILIWLVGLGVAQAVPSESRTSIERDLRSGSWKSALKQAEDLVDDHPSDTEAHLLLALALKSKMEAVSQVRAMMSLGDYKDALAKAISLDPENTEARSEQIGFLIMAPGIAGGDTEEAAEKIEALRRIDRFQAMRMDALLAQAQQESDREQEILLELNRLEPGNADNVIRLAYYWGRAGEFEKSDALWVDLENDDDSVVALNALYQRARLRIMEERDIPEAEKMLHRFIADHASVPDDGGKAPLCAAYWRLGLAEELLGKREAAIASLRQSLALNEDYEPAEEALDRLD